MLSPRERRYFKTKEAILQAARELIAEKGPDGLSLRELARRIDYSPSGLYEYFPSKDDIVNAVCAEGLVLLCDYLNRAPADLPPSQRLIEMGLGYMDFAREHPEHFRLIFIHLSDDQVGQVKTGLEESPYHILSQTVQDAIEAGEISVEDGFSLEEITFSLWAQVHGMALLEQTYLRHLQTDLTPLLRRTLQVFSQGLRNKKLLPE